MTTLRKSQVLKMTIIQKSKVLKMTIVQNFRVENDNIQTKTYQSVRGQLDTCGGKPKLIP